MNPITTVMRVKNEELYLEHALKSLQPLGGRIVLLDDGSTDRTPEIAKSFDWVEYIRRNNAKMDEGRDRTLIYREALKHEPEWIFTLDGDETLDGETPALMLRAIDLAPSDVNVFEMFLAVMQSPVGSKEQRWLGPIQPQGAWSMDRMFRVRDADRSHRFKSDTPGNLHCGCVPAMRNRHHEKLNAWIRYYGYESKAAIKKKHEFYSTHDPNHFHGCSQLWQSRESMPAINYPARIDCREIGITNTVRY